MSIDELPALDPALEALFAAERELPPPPPGLEARLLARLGATLGWSGGAGGAGLGLKLLGVVLAVVVAGGAVGIGWLATRGGGGHRPETGQSPAALARRSALPASVAAAAAERALPAWFGEPTRPDVAIAGRVMSAEGHIVAGARVVLTSNATRAGIVPGLELISDAHGAFDFGPHRAAVYDVTAAASGQGEGHVRINTLDATERPSPGDVTVTLPGCAHALHGVVRDASGGVIAGASFSRARGVGADVSVIGIPVVTDERGAYELCTPPGPLTAVVRADGYGTVKVAETVIGRRQLDVELVPGATLVGRVLRVEDDRPVAGAMVWLRPSSFAPRVRATPDGAVTDVDGRFRFTGVEPGRHQVFATTGDAMTPPPGVQLVLEPGRESAEVIVRISDLGVHVDGRVVEDGRPVAGARVFALVDGQRQGGGWPPTGVDGRFRIRLRDAGPIGFALDSHDVLAPATHEATLGTTSVVVEVSSRGAIRGEVRLDGKPVAGAEVGAIGPALEGRRNTIAGADGRFELAGLPAGRYRLFAQSFAAQAFSSDGEQAVDLPARTIRDGVVIELDGAASIAGTVLDQDGAPVARVAVKYTHATTGDLCNATTGARGEFTCAMLSGGGDYTPLVRLDETSAMQLPAATAGGLATVHVADGRSRVTGVVLRVRLVRATLRGRVTDRGGAPYPDVSVRALEGATGYTPDTAPWVTSRPVITDVDGRFALPVWSEATYTVHARAPDGAEAAQAGVTAAAEVELRLDRAGRITGTFAGFDQRPRLAVRRLGNTTELASPSVEGDRFVVEGLSAGTYAVLAIAGAQGAAETVAVTAGADARVTLRARPTARLDAQVIDHVSGGPVAGVRCTVAPFVEGAGVAWFGLDGAPTDAAGRFTADVPSGSIEVTCHPRSTRYSEGAARMVATAGGTAPITIPIVVSPTDDYAGNGLGVRTGFAHAPVSGHIHTIVELRPGGSGERAGLRVGDVIVAIDGRDVTVLTDSGLARLVGTHAVGAIAQVTRIRTGARAVVAVPVEPPWWP